MVGSAHRAQMLGPVAPEGDLRIDIDRRDDVVPRTGLVREQGIDGIAREDRLGRNGVAMMMGIDDRKVRIDRLLDMPGQPIAIVEHIPSPFLAAIPWCRARPKRRPGRRGEGQE